MMTLAEERFLFFVTPLIMSLHYIQISMGQKKNKVRYNDGNYVNR